MANLQNIRRRIRSVKSIQKITNAMDMIARSRFNAAKDTLLSNIPYVEKTRDIIKRIMSQMSTDEESPFVMSRQALIDAQSRTDGKFLFLVIAADKGLAGAYSSNIFKEAHATIEYDGTSPEESDADKEESFHKKNFDAVKMAKGVDGDQLKAQHGMARAGSRRTANVNKVNVAQDTHDADYVDDIEIITVGRKATSHFKQRGYKIIKSYYQRTPKLSVRQRNCRFNH